MDAQQREAFGSAHEHWYEAERYLLECQNARARDAYLDALEAARLCGEGLTQAVLSLRLGRVLMAMGAYDDAQRVLEVGLTLCRAEKLLHLEPLLALALGETALHRNRVGEAIRVLEQGRERFERNYCQTGVAHTTFWRGVTLTRLEGMETGTATLELACHQARQLNSPALEARAWVGVARRRHRDGDSLGASRAWDEAESSLRSISDREGLGWVRLEQAELLRGGGRPWEAWRKSREALGYFQEARAHEGVRMARQVLRQWPWWRAAWNAVLETVHTALDRRRLPAPR